MFVIPTTGTVATVACLNPSTGGSTGTCEEAAATVRLTGARALALGGRPAYAKALNAALDRLEGRRAGGRKKLAGAKLPAGQQKAARNLAGAYDDAAGALRRAPDGPAERPAEAALVRSAAQISDGYSRLAGAAGDGDRAAYRRAADAIRNAERGFGRALEAFRSIGYTTG